MLASDTPGRSPDAHLTVVAPVFNEEDVLEPFVAQLTATLRELPNLSWDVLLVDDGSTDGTRAALIALNQRDPRFHSVVLSRNFGKETAVAAGLQFADGDAVVVMDSDLQHPPQVILALLERWHAGFKIVFAQRSEGHDESPARRLASSTFHWVFKSIARTPLPKGAVDFLLMDRQAVEAMNRLGERVRFNKGLYAWLGFRAAFVPFKAGKRRGGQSSWRLTSLTRFALDGLVSFSALPLKVSSWCGLIISALALLYAVSFLFRTLWFGTDVAGFPSLIISIMFFAGAQLISLGVLGEYVARIYEEVKARPLYLVDEVIGGRELRKQPRTRSTAHDAAPSRS